MQLCVCDLSSLLEFKFLEDSAFILIFFKLLKTARKYSKAKESKQEPKTKAPYFSSWIPFDKLAIFQWFLISVFYELIWEFFLRMEILHPLALL